MANTNPIKDHPVVAGFLVILTIAATLITMRKDLILSRSPAGPASDVNGNHSSHHKASPDTANSGGQVNTPIVVGNGGNQFNAPAVVGNNNKQFNGPVGTIDVAPIAPDPTTKQGAREVLGKMGLKYDLEGFDDAVRGGQLDAIKLYLRGGQSPNAYMGFTFILDGAIANAPSQFGEILQLFQTQSDEKLNFRTESPGGISLEDELFDDLSKQDVAHNGQILIKAGANPDNMLKRLQAQQTALKNTFESNSGQVQNQLSVIEQRISYLQALRA